MKTKTLAMLAAAAALALAGCTTAPIQNVEKAPIVLASGKTSVTMTDVNNAIIRAGTRLGWQMKPESPGRLTGHLALRTHTAIVAVEHDTTTYSIKYRDSTNLDAKDGMIHKNYNGWVQNLDKAIKSELVSL
jgi:hypothetical protein